MQTFFYLSIVALFIPFVTGTPEAPKQNVEVMESVIEKPLVVPEAVVEPQTPEDYARQKVDERWGDEHWDAFNKLVHKESGWRVDAENKSSGAYGIPQCLPVSKCIAEYPDFKTNPTSQINWMLDYVGQRYGDPINALNFHLSHRWY